MTNPVRIGVVLLIVLATSCQKELHFDTDTSNRPFRIVTTVAVTGNDTLITEYGYDQQLRLASEVTTGRSAGETYYTNTQFSRDAQGRITTVVYKGLDDSETVNVDVHYPDATGMEYDYAIATRHSSGTHLRDSIAFSYSNGNMVKNERFRYKDGAGYLLARRETFDHNAAGNVESTEVFSTIGTVNGHVVLISTTQYTYAGYPDYIWTTDNASQNYLLAGLPNRSHESISEAVVRDQTGLAADYSMSTILVMDATGRMPETGSAYLFPQNTTTSLAFYYQFF